jgi:hypothetical protein
MRSMKFALRLLATVFAASAAAQNYAMFSPAAVAGFAAEKDTPAARSEIRAADEALGRPPHPLAVVHEQGMLPHTGGHDEAVLAQHDWPAMRALALTYRLTGDKKYLDGTTRYMDAWFPLYKSSADPIDETALDNVVLAFDLTRSDLPQVTEAHMVAFCHDMAAKYLDWLDKRYMTDPDNWSSHRVKLALLGAYAAGDKALIQRGGVAFTRHLRQNLRADGSVADFYKRDALHYVVYDLEPLTMACLAARAHGYDWFHASIGGLSVAHSIDWLVPYAEGEKTHEEFVHSSVEWDHTRDKAGLKGYSGTWERSTSLDLYTMAAWLDPKYQPVVQSVAAASDKKQTPWLVLAIGNRKGTARGSATAAGQ